MQNDLSLTVKCDRESRVKSIHTVIGIRVHKEDIEGCKLVPFTVIMYRSALTGYLLPGHEMKIISSDPDYCYVLLDPKQCNTFDLREIETDTAKTWLENKKVVGTESVQAIDLFGY